MSQENVEIVARIYECLNSGDWDAAFCDVHEDVEVETQRMGSFRGRSEARGFYEDQAAAFEFVIVEQDEILDAGDQIVALLRSVGNHAAAPLRSRFG